MTKLTRDACRSVKLWGLENLLLGWFKAADSTTLPNLFFTWERFPSLTNSIQQWSNQKNTWTQICWECFDFEIFLDSSFKNPSPNRFPDLAQTAKKRRKQLDISIAWTTTNQKRLQKGPSFLQLPWRGSIISGCYKRSVHGRQHSSCIIMHLFPVLQWIASQKTDLAHLCREVFRVGTPGK